MPDTSTTAAIDALRAPDEVFTRSQVVSQPSVVPRVPGAYAWYFDVLPPGVPSDGCHVNAAGVLLYVGIAPKEPPRNGSPSQQTLWKRLRNHYRANASTSTLRLTLGCHLAGQLGIELRRYGSSERLRFTISGERRLSEWMGEHTQIAWAEHPRPWEVEALAMHRMDLPLNLQGNTHNEYYSALKDLRACHRAKARELPAI